MPKHYGFIGFGLIGGSIARSMKSWDDAPVLTAYQYTAIPSHSLTIALSDGILDSVTTDLSAFAVCDMIFLCAPVQKNLEYLPLLKQIISPSCILTDVGSVKGTIHEQIRHLEMEECFIGGHPMTGSEKTGYENSDSLLLENAYYILTPTEKTTEPALTEYLTLVKKLGSLPIILYPEEHDRITAAISHVPHIIASQLVNLVQYSGPLEPKMKLLAAGGFKDITRIASASPEIWQSICLSNKDCICEQLTVYQQLLEEAKQFLLSGQEDSLYQMFDRAGNYRDAIPAKAKGVLATPFELFTDIKDETGAIATIAAMLSAHGISIKNIGIVHNREFEQGVLHMELYDETSRQNTADLLRIHGYTVYLRS